jgi:glycosyltransferase involved in cell wall biosynthesis
VRAPPRTALVHDFLVSLRGADRVFLTMCQLWPEADVFTTVYDEDGTEGRFADRRIHTSFLQRMRPNAGNFRLMLPFYPAAIQALDLSDYDLVVSSSSAWAHAVRCDERAVHVCYCHNPFRYIWNEREATLRGLRDPVTRAVLRALFDRWRRWDRAAAQRVDRYVTTSQLTVARVKAYLGRDATIVHPPVDTHRFRPGRVGDHYVVLSELVFHKRIEVAVRAFNLLGLPLIVVGGGPEARRLERLAGPTVRLAGRLGDLEVANLLRSCRALIVTAIEEFGIAAVEAQAAGRPVIARRGGGALETIRDGKTGCFWSGGPAELAAAVLAFDDGAIDPRACVENASRFSVDAFKRRLLTEVELATSRATPGGERPLRRTPPLRAADGERSEQSAAAAN